MISNYYLAALQAASPMGSRTSSVTLLWRRVGMGLR
jgi:hypothetical protein